MPKSHGFAFGTVRLSKSYQAIYKIDRFRLQLLFHFANKNWKANIMPETSLFGQTNKPNNEVSSLITSS